MFVQKYRYNILKVRFCCFCSFILSYLYEEVLSPLLGVLVII